MIPCPILYTMFHAVYLLWTRREAEALAAGREHSGGFVLERTAERFAQWPV
jgi:hypothetical protein